MLNSYIGTVAARLKGDAYEKGRTNRRDRPGFNAGLLQWHHRRMHIKDIVREMMV